MRNPWKAAVALVALLALCSACGGDYTLTLTEEQKRAVTIDGWNQTGRTDLDEDDWFDIVRAACEGDPDSEATLSSVVVEWELDRQVPTADAVQSLWLIAIQVCRERFPEEYQLP